MPRNKDQKRVIRTRMTKTGESYTAARLQILSTPKVRTVPQPGVDYAALAAMSDEKIASTTGRTWREWVKVLDAENAAAMPHREITAILHGSYKVGDWWGQAVAVGYERIKGLRQVGQRRSGAFEVSKSRTFAVPVDTLVDAWADDATRARWLRGVKTTVRKAGVRRKVTAPRTLRLQWQDETIVVAWFQAKSATKSVVALAHTKLPSKAAADGLKTFWSDRLDALAALFAS